MRRAKQGEGRACRPTCQPTHLWLECSRLDGRTSTSPRLLSSTTLPGRLNRKMNLAWLATAEPPSAEPMGACEWPAVGTERSKVNVLSRGLVCDAGRGWSAPTRTLQTQCALPVLTCAHATLPANGSAVSMPMTHPHPAR